MLPGLDTRVISQWFLGQPSSNTEDLAFHCLPLALVDAQFAKDTRKKLQFNPHSDRCTGTAAAFNTGAALVRALVSFSIHSKHVM